MDPLLRSFQDAVIVRNVVARTKAAMEFPTDEARKDYLRDHPGADPSNHTVKKNPGEGGGSKGEHHGKYPDSVVEKQLGGKFKTKAEASKPGGALHDNIEYAKSELKKVHSAIDELDKEADHTDGVGVNPTTMKDLKTQMSNAHYLGLGLETQTKNIRSFTDWDDSEIEPLRKPAEDAKKAALELKALLGKAPNVKDERKGQAVLNYASKVRAVMKKFEDAVSDYEKAAKA
jgi:hypothetical protein